MRRAETRGRDSGGVTAKDEHTAPIADTFFTAPGGSLPLEVDGELDPTTARDPHFLPSQCKTCGGVYSPVEAKVWSEAAQTAHLALYICPDDGTRWTQSWLTVQFWLDHKPATVQTFTPPTPIAQTIDQRPVFARIIDASDTGPLPPSGTQVNYRYALGKTGNFATGKRKGHVVIHARWADNTGRRYKWKREFESRTAAFEFGHERGYSGIDETRQLNRRAIMYFTEGY